jgi:hypothetical protein
MTQITTKELSGLSDLLTVETNMVAKCRAYAAQTSDGELKSKYEQLAARHQRHCDELYANLK